jgi:cytochrome c-type biogenesis protein CcsB
MSCLAVLALAAPAAAGPELEAVRLLAIQDGGRVKPLDTFARETARRVAGARFAGGESVAGLEPVEWVLAMLAAPEKWRAEPIVRVTHAGLRGAVALPAGRVRFSFAELVSHEPFLRAAEAVHEKMRADARLDPVEEEIATLYDTLSLMAGIFSGEALRLVPVADPKGAWLSVADLGGAGPTGDSLRPAFGELVAAHGAGDRARLATAAATLQARLAEVAPKAYPARADLAREVHYNGVKPFRWSWVLYLGGFLALLMSFPTASGLLSRAGLALALAGFAMNAYGMALRTLISGRAPVTNMYETVVFVAWGVVLFALLFERGRAARYATACASALAVVSLLLADNVPIMDGSISPLVPVLRDNFWLTAHVLTIMLGYAAFLLAMGLGHVNLALHFFAPRRAALLKTLSQLLYRSLQAGTLFLAAGTLLGGVWASYSWGRFWGWDPKETWSLIALLGYLAVLHGRLLGWLKDFGMAVGSIVGFLLVLMAWYGVNFILGTGLHSYGFGSGGSGWVAGFVAFEVLVIAAAALRRRAQAAPAAGLQPAAPSRA